MGLGMDLPVLLKNSLIIKKEVGSSRNESQGHSKWNLVGR